MGKIINFSELTPLQQRQLADSLARQAGQKIEAEKPFEQYLDEVWQNLKLSQRALKDAKSSYERELIVEIASCDNRRRKAWLELKLVEERDRQRKYDEV